MAKNSFVAEVTFNKYIWNFVTANFDACEPGVCDPGNVLLSTW